MEDKEHTLEKLKIHERLVVLETIFTEHTKREMEAIKDLKDSNKMLSESITGNGKEGLSSKVNSFVREFKSHTKTDFLWFTTIIGLLLFVVGELMLKR